MTHPRLALPLLTGVGSPILRLLDAILPSQGDTSWPVADRKAAEQNVW
jgi:hypothetical protein